MKFEFIEYNKKATDEELLADLKRVAIELDKDCITQSEYNEKGQFHCDTVSKRFGSWNEALSIIGLKSGNQFFDNQYTRTLRENFDLFRYLGCVQL